ncbi:MAG: hypothetical protein IJ131_03820 [Eggerthellaceae bacterium]|nr:hypothetical protein [Eggerthellaceae bacterium]
MVDVYGTLGPACADADTLECMIGAGMTGVRLNLSHAMLSDAEEMLDAFSKAQERCGARIKLLVDLQGPELRVGFFDTPLVLAEGDVVALCALQLPQALQDALEPGDDVLLDDGKILLVVDNGRVARVVRGGVLSSRKSVAVPGKRIDLPPLTEADLENLAHAVHCGVYGVMQPFVRSRDDLLAVRSALATVGGSAIKVFAKLESLEGVSALPELFDAADEFVIARGDLGNSMPLWDVPAMQKRIARACGEAGAPFMVVTQMLASMERNAVPTRAEVSDIFNAVVDGASSVMVTGETAVGAHPVEAIRYLANTVAAAEAF